jgi:hypothetical protein
VDNQLSRLSTCKSWRLVSYTTSVAWPRMCKGGPHLAPDQFHLFVARPKPQPHSPPAGFRSALAHSFLILMQSGARVTALCRNPPTHSSSLGMAIRPIYLDIHRISDPMEPDTTHKLPVGYSKLAHSLFFWSSPYYTTKSKP